MKRLFLLMLPLVLLAGCTTAPADENTDPTPPGNRLPYHEEVEVVGVWPINGRQEVAKENDLVLYRGTEERAEHFFVPYELWTGKVSETELQEGIKLNFSGRIVEQGAGAGNRRYDVVKVDVLMTWR